jgi:hypothetical protein
VRCLLCRRAVRPRRPARQRAAHKHVREPRHAVGALTVRGPVARTAVRGFVPRPLCLEFHPGECRVEVCIDGAVATTLRLHVVAPPPADSMSACSEQRDRSSTWRSFSRRRRWCRPPPIVRGSQSFRRDRTGMKCKASGIVVAVSEASWSDLPARVNDAERFLRENREELSRLRSFPGVEDMALDFQSGSVSGRRCVCRRIAFRPL